MPEEIFETCCACKKEFNKEWCGYTYDGKEYCNGAECEKKLKTNRQGRFEADRPSG